MPSFVVVGVGGFLGAMLRYLVSGWVQHTMDRTTFPYGTLAVNVIGSFTLGVFYFLGDVRGLFGPTARQFLAIGLLGGFTTFSTFSVETIGLFSSTGIAAASWNVILHLGLCLGAVIMARWLVIALWG